MLSDDIRPAFDNDDEADAAFTMFDKDMAMSCMIIFSTKFKVAAINRR